jgi:hypothetical protein
MLGERAVRRDPSVYPTTAEYPYSAFGVDRPLLGWSDGGMKLYADTPVRRTRQLFADLLFVLWLVGWVWVGHVVHDGTDRLAGVGQQTDASASQLASGLTSAGDSLRNLPVVGGGVASPFDQMSSASDALAQAGRDQVSAVHRLAWVLGISIGAIPILTVGAFFVPVRWRFAREATAGARFIDANEDLDLFALRALARQPMHVLARVSDDPAGAWRAGDPEIVTALASLELRDSGLRVPARLS